ncbi:MAG: L,D-transpeptidase family protein [Candidatus Nanopelagicales bacterium]
MRRPLTSQARLTPAKSVSRIGSQPLRLGAISTACAALVLAPVMAPSAQAASSGVSSVSAPTSNCRTQVPGLKASFTRQIKANSSQVVVVRGNSKRAWHNRVQYWQKSNGCWNKVRGVAGRNGITGWNRKPTDGSGLSPIGVYTLTDAGGRLRNPGTRLPYHYGPQAYDRGGYRMNNKRVQVFDYLVAINFNRFPGSKPHDLRRPDPTIKDGGIWFHVRGSGPTRGCVSVKRSQMKWTLRWLRPAAHPTIVMGPKQTLSG